MTQPAGTPQWSVPDRLPVLSRGAHPPGSAKPCAMEAASWLAGEVWSDHPRSVHPVVASMARWVNDSVDDYQRQSLWPLIMASLGTSVRRRPLLTLRLRWEAAAARRRAFASGEPVGAWSDLLGVYRRLTRQPAPAALSQPLTTTRPSMSGWMSHR